MGVVLARTSGGFAQAERGVAVARTNPRDIVLADAVPLRADAEAGVQPDAQVLEVSPKTIEQVAHDRLGKTLGLRSRLGHDVVEPGVHDVGALPHLVLLVVHRKLQEGRVRGVERDTLEVVRARLFGRDPEHIALEPFAAEPPGLRSRNRRAQAVHGHDALRNESDPHHSDAATTADLLGPQDARRMEGFLAERLAVHARRRAWPEVVRLAQGVEPDAFLHFQVRTPSDPMTGCMHVNVLLDFSQFHQASSTREWEARIQKE